MTETGYRFSEMEHAMKEPSFTLADLDARKARRVARSRVTAMTVGLILTVAVAGGLFLVLTSDQPSDIAGGARIGASTLPVATQQPLVATDGRYYIRSVLLGGCAADETTACPQDAYRLDATYWWSPGDDSGRIALDDRQNVGIEGGEFPPGTFPDPNGIDVSTFPLATDELTRFMLARSDAEGSSPAPVVTPPPEGAPLDGQMWRAITDLLGDPHVTPAVRAALLDVAASLQGSHLTLDAADPFGRPAHVIEFGNWGGELIERLYVDPATHELLGWTKSAAGAAVPFEYLVVQDAGVVDSTREAPAQGSGSVPVTLLSGDDFDFGSTPSQGGAVDGPEASPAGA